MALLEVRGIAKSYPGLPVLADATFAVDEGEIVCLLGPSGCGKTTALRVIAGLEEPDRGQVWFDDQDLAGVPVHRRNFGFMFQEYALFPHQNVAENVAFGLRMQGLTPAATVGRVAEMLALVDLRDYERRRVVDLSGGEQQRVALARSLAPGPRLLMLDEPLGSLDRALREQLMNELRAILKRVGLTALYVTHDQGEAFAIADRVLIMHARLEAGEGGHIEQDDTPRQVYRYPASTYVAQFLGFRNLIPGIVEEEAGGSASDGLSVATSLGRLYAADSPRRFAPGAKVVALVRPEAADVRRAGDAGPNVIAGRLLESSFRGSYYLVRTAHAGGIVLQCEVPATDTDLPGVGEALSLRLDPTAVTLLPT